MKLVTWNVNSIRAREARLRAWIEQHQPDVLCLQELKCERPQLDALGLPALGYELAAACQKSWNGVAILSRRPLTDVQEGMQDGEEDPQARVVSARVDGIRIVCGYFPNGGALGSDKWLYKLRWLQRLRAYLDRTAKADEPLALCGDFNVAPEDRDVHDPALWADTVLCHPEVRAALAHVAAFGLVDAVRLHHPEAGLFSWWDYQQLAFPKGRGLRIDHVFVTQPLVARVQGSAVDREERKGKLPSDHAPVVVTIA